MMLKKTTYIIDKMDCPSEERMIRMKLEELNMIIKLSFDIPKRKMEAVHKGSPNIITENLAKLKLGSKYIKTENISDLKLQEEHSTEKKLLWIVLLINASFFIIEMTFGIIAGSMGLSADSLDMLADASVYGLSLMAVGGSIIKKKKIARVSGFLQMVLAFAGFIEVIRRFLFSEFVPDFSIMIIIAFLALIANIASLYILKKGESKEAHMQASMIFTSNDIIVNTGVILAGILVSLFSSNIPDLLIGLIVFIAVMRGAIRIINLSK